MHILTYYNSQEQVDSQREEKMKQKLEVDSESLKDNLKIYEEMLEAKRYTGDVGYDGRRKYPNGSEDRKRN